MSKQLLYFEFKLSMINIWITHSQFSFPCKVIVDIDMAITLVDVEFTEDLKNTSSAAYLELAKDIYTEVNNYLQLILQLMFCPFCQKY